ncbi:phosphodiester glycosidase family protein [Actinomadura logoneensis]|uniref:phosphodiester glycosidase family protein n=1 Tax=Actinomadura logoneensis TaxID=2293572 RepID=UPI0018F1592C|nr:phosphodiester glycosidase family protein [Actinomadura logoneensis]
MLTRITLVLALVPAAPPAHVLRIAPGVVARELRDGRVGATLLEIDLDRARIGVLRPSPGEARARVSEMANRARAVAGVNGDFFDISERVHRGVPATFAPDGPEVADGRAVRAAVPAGQRFGPTAPPGSSGAVIGVDRRGVGRVGRLSLTGTVRAGGRTIRLRGLNQYALPVGGVGLYTSAWGPASRARAFCGNDFVRAAPCTHATAAVLVRDGKVAGTADPGGALPPGADLLLGREEGATALRALHHGQRLRISSALSGSVRFRQAIGGLPLLRDGEPAPGLDARSRSPRTAAGLARGGHRMDLLVVNGGRETGSGETAAGLAALFRRLGARDALLLDGGGSSTLAFRLPGEHTATVRNTPSDGRERPVANGIGVFG